MVLNHGCWTTLATFVALALLVGLSRGDARVVERATDGAIDEVALAEVETESDAALRARG